MPREYSNRSVPDEVAYRIWGTLHAANLAPSRGQIWRGTQVLKCWASGRVGITAPIPPRTATVPVTTGREDQEHQSKSNA